jgi:hypothetical protein
MLPISTVIALLLAPSVLLLVTMVMAQVQVRRERAANADLQHALAARARRTGHPEEARRRDTLADVPTHRVWPFRPRPAVEFEVPTGLVTVTSDLTGVEYERLKARWEEQLGQIAARADETYPTLPRPRTRWWRR